MAKINVVTIITLIVFLLSACSPKQPAEIIETPVSEWESSEFAAAAAEADIVCTVKDKKSGKQPNVGYFDMQSGTILITGDEIVATVFLKETPPETLLVNLNDWRQGNTENQWGIYIDLDGDLKTGNNIRPTSDNRSEEATGVDYNLQATNYKKYDEEQKEVVFTEYFTSDVLKWEGSSGYVISSESVEVDAENNALIMRANLPGVNENSRFYFFTYCAAMCEDDHFTDTMYEVKCQQN